MKSTEVSRSRARATRVAVLADTFTLVHDAQAGRHRDDSRGRGRGGLLLFVAVALLATAVGFGLTQLLPQSAEPLLESETVGPTLATLTAEPTPTLTAGVTTPPTEAPSATQAPSATSSATTSTPQPTPTSPSARPTRRPSRTPTQTPTATTTPPAVGTLRVNPRALNLTRSQPGATGTVRLTALDGAVSWTASAPDGIFLDDFSGDLAAGETVLVEITVDPNLPEGTQTFTVVFSPGSLTVSVTVP